MHRDVFPVLLHRAIFRNQPGAVSRWMMVAAVLKNIRINNSRTLVRLLAEFWRDIDALCVLSRMSRDDLLSDIFDKKPKGMALTSAIKIHIITFYRERAVRVLPIFI